MGFPLRSKVEIKSKRFIFKFKLRPQIIAMEPSAYPLSST
jgi:hypothetical protein